MSTVPRLLIAAGNYDIVKPLMQCLKEDGIYIKVAYTHRDTLYMLQQQRFNLIVVDAAMFDRHTSEFTVAALDRLKNPLPRIAVAQSPDLAEKAEKMAVAVITDLTKQEIRGAISGILGQYMPARHGHTVNLAAERGLEEMNTLFHVSKSLSEVLELSEVLNRVVEAARRVTNSDEGMILLPDEDNPGELLLRARVGIDLETARNFRVKMEDTIAGEVFKTGKSTLMGKQGPLKVKTQYLVNSLLYVPIILKNETIGVLGVSNKSKEDIFDIHHEDLLRQLASFAAIAIENAVVHEESLARTHELSMLVGATQNLGKSLALEATLVNICEQIEGVLKASRTEIFEWDQRTSKFVKRAQSLRGIWRPLHGRLVELNSRPQLKAAIEGNQHVTLIEDDMETLVIPVHSSGRIMGAVRAIYLKSPARNLDSVTLKRARNTGLEALAGALHTSDMAPQDAILRTMVVLQELLDADWCELLLASESGIALFLLSEVGRAVWSKPPYPPMPEAEQEQYREVLQTREALERPNNKAVMIFPLVHRDAVWGLVKVTDNDSRRVFTPREIDMTKALVAQSATALENARLVKDLEDSVRELRETQDRLVQTARLTAIGELAAVVAHQINNPLTTIIVDAELLMLGEEKNSPKFKQFEAIHRAGQRATGVARRLLAIARPNDPNAQPDQIDVVDTVNGILQLVGTHIERRNITIHTKMPPEDLELPPVLAIKGRLDDIWLNLMMNAYDALGSQENAALGVEVEYIEDNGNIVVRIWDNGPGIPEELRDRIFEPFFTTKPAGEGTGIGLHVCRQEVESVNGWIEVESYVGKGTRFTITLPSIKSAQAHPEALKVEDRI